MKGFITIAEFAAREKISVARARQLYYANRIPGAEKLGTTIAIPENAVYTRINQWAKKKEQAK